MIRRRRLRRREGEAASAPLLMASAAASDDAAGDAFLSPRISWNIPLLQSPDSPTAAAVVSSNTFPVSLEEAASLEEQWNQLDRLDGVLARRPPKSCAALLALDSLDTASETSLASSSFHTTTSSSSSSNSNNSDPPTTPMVPGPATTIQWADACGHKLATTYRIVDAPARRLVLLLVHPVAHKFEFLHLEYDTTIRLPIADVLAQIPDLCTSHWFQQLTYATLLLRHDPRKHASASDKSNNNEKSSSSTNNTTPTSSSNSSSNYTELIQVLSFQDYGLGWNETLVAVADSFHPIHIQARANQLLTCAPLQKVVKKAKFTGRALQRIGPLGSVNSSNNNTNNNSETNDAKVERPGTPPCTPPRRPTHSPKSAATDLAVSTTTPTPSALRTPPILKPSRLDLLMTAAIGSPQLSPIPALDDDGGDDNNCFVDANTDDWVVDWEDVPDFQDTSHSDDNHRDDDIVATATVPPVAWNQHHYFS